MAGGHEGGEGDADRRRDGYEVFAVTTYEVEVPIRMHGIDPEVNLGSTRETRFAVHLRRVR